MWVHIRSLARRDRSQGSQSPRLRGPTAVDRSLLGLAVGLRDAKSGGSSNTMAGVRGDAGDGRRRYTVSRWMWVLPWLAMACAVTRGGEDDPGPTPAIPSAAAPPNAVAEQAPAAGNASSTLEPSSVPPTATPERIAVRDGDPSSAADVEASHLPSTDQQDPGVVAPDSVPPLESTGLPQPDPDATPDARDEATTDDATAEDATAEDATTDDATADDPQGSYRAPKIELAPELQPLPERTWIRHRRAPRESLTQIARRYDVSVHHLRKWNDLRPGAPAPRRSKRIKVRARRSPPAREQIEYTVREGDTWWSVSLRHGVDGRNLRAYNYPYRKKMKPGATLRIWIDPIVHRWISEGADPLPPDDGREQRRGALSQGSPNDGTLLNGLRIPDDPGVELRLPRSAYGSSHGVEQLMLAIDHFHERNEYPYPVPIGSMSRPRGGEMGSHLSHQSGRDVDIRLLRRPGISKYRDLKGSRIQWDAVWDLLLALAETDVMVIFLDYKVQGRLHREAAALGATPDQLEAMLQWPRGRRAARGLVRHSPGHEQHVHVRFGCGPFETECVP